MKMAEATTDHVLFRCLLLMVVAAPLPFASVRLWAWSGCAVVVGLILLIHAAGQLAGLQPRVPTPRSVRVMAALFLAASAWILFQSTSFAPHSLHHPFWRDVAGIMTNGQRGFISLDPSRSQQGLAHLLTYGGVFWLFVHYCRDVRRAETTLKWLTVSNCAYAVYGLAEQFSGTETILWYPKFAYLGDLTSTFVNRNNYATFAGLGWLCVLASLFRSYSAWTRGLQGQERTRQTLIFFEKTGWISLIAMLIQATALFLSHSRAGFASSILGIVLFCIALSINRAGDKGLSRRFIYGCIGLALAFFAASGHVVDERIASTSFASEERLLVYSRTEEAITDQPLLGTGLGTFEEVFRLYRPDAVLATFDYAHNTYLETALEIGVPATIALFLPQAIAMVQLWLGARRRRRDNVYACLGIGAMTLVATHSLLDFSIQIPAVAITYSGLLGLAIAQAFSSREILAPNPGGPGAETTLPGKAPV